MLHQILTYHNITLHSNLIGERGVTRNENDAWHVHYWYVRMCALVDGQTKSSFLVQRINALINSSLWSFSSHVSCTPIFSSICCLLLPLLFLLSPLFSSPLLLNSPLLYPLLNSFLIFSTLFARTPPTLYSVSRIRRF